MRIDLPTQVTEARGISPILKRYIYQQILAASYVASSEQSFPKSLPNLLYDQAQFSVTFGIESSRQSVQLGVFTDGDSEAATLNLVSGRKAQSRADSEACFDLAAHSLKNCLSSHSSSCPHDATAVLPTRVLDVGTDKNSNQIRLFESKGLTEPWVALSHCWGRVARYVTETTTLEQRIQGIALSELPKTFLDAVTITRRLGYRYLWIDSLCILQDSHQDWADESRRMQDYYSKAILTIASDVAAGDHESFLDNIREPLSSLKIPFNPRTGTTPSHVYISKETKLPAEESARTPLNVRGWTLQEDVLSPRTLHYTSTELVFECQRSSLAETDMTPQGYTDISAMNSIKRFFLRPDASSTDPILVKYPHYLHHYHPLQRWYRLFEEYCTRLLTFESDRLAAISGLAKEIQRQTKFSYMAGLWLEDLHHGLLWTVNGRGTRSGEYRAPSWSWAALDMNFYWGLTINPNFQLYMQSLWNQREDGECIADIISCDVQTVNEDPFSEVESAQLRLRGYVLPLSEWQGKTPPYINKYWRPVVFHQSTSTDGGIRGPVASDQLVLDFDVTLELEGSDTTDGNSLEVASHEGGNKGEGESEEEEENEHNIQEASGLQSADMFLFQIKRLALARVTVVSCLLLARQTRDGDALVYHRIGRAEVPEINDLARDRWVQREITIV
ncbi:hypothetical protein PVAG01_07452 [Phlyctema vagabunda]|uniref:Heterokaryon incompatibility domain-containing protein n=1 Tax=Phlyctema vagabunda TaxID=108571 RepID=A0ABR4PCH4_9HELO